MRLLVAIQNTFPGEDSTLIFTYAWRNFVKRYQSSLPNIEFVFINNGLDQGRFNSILSGCQVAHVPLNGHQFLWDTDTSFCPFYAGCPQYDYVMRIDNDAFPSPESLRALYDFLLVNPQVDFVSATNFCRQIDSEDNTKYLSLDNRGTRDEDKSSWPFLPWGYPTTNSDMYIFKSSFFHKCLNEYYQCSKIVKPYPPYTPFNTSSLQYKDICALLNYTETRFDVEQNNVRIRIDGGINSDFWTILCALKPVMAGVVSHDGRSFQLKNHLLSYGKCKSQNVGYDSIVDVTDTSWHHALTVKAPYFHMGNAYVVAGLFYPSHYMGIQNIIDQFAGAEICAQAVLQYHMVDFLSTHACTDTAFKNRLDNNMNGWFQQHSIAPSKVMQTRQELLDFYMPVLQHYLSV